MIEGSDESSAPTTVWRIGENLPWVVPWTAEDRFGVRPSRTFPGRSELVQVEQPGEGAPMLKGMNLMRQRRGVVEFCCHVCGRVTSPNDRHLFPVQTGAILKVKGAARYATHLPPTHAACAAKAARLCPHLRHSLAHPVAFPRDPGFLAPETSLPGSFSHLAGRLPEDGSVIYGYFRVFGEGFTRVVKRLRAEAAAIG